MNMLFASFQSSFSLYYALVNHCLLFQFFHLMNSENSERGQDVIEGETRNPLFEEGVYQLSQYRREAIIGLCDMGNVSFARKIVRKHYI